VLTFCQCHEALFEVIEQRLGLLHKPPDGIIWDPQKIRSNICEKKTMISSIIIIKY